MDSMLGLLQEDDKNVLIAVAQGVVPVLVRKWIRQGKSLYCASIAEPFEENARAIGSRGGISSLLEICQAGTPSSQAVAARVLRNLSIFPEIKENFIEENAISILLSLSASGTSFAQENSIGCLCNLVSDDDDQLKLFIAREGGIESLKNFWDSAPTPRSLEVAVELLRNLASCPLISEVLVSDGFVNRIVSVLNCGVLG
ncbi:Vacuolar protein 8 [Camellia lanceoleosa]|uniref:Vacuolar protein 8 n=1 Tax=Camellia lanceoleosa TaxID=1840588 RepID=A0ACC0I4X8_9ERIC|nr:Vacuolar protein 8 [Camellia lanceoleosa]